MKDGTRVKCLCDVNGIPAGSIGSVVTTRDIKETDRDYIELLKNGIRMSTGPVAVVQFKRDWRIVKIADLSIVSK